MPGVGPIRVARLGHSASARISSNDERDLGLAFSLEARILIDHLRVIYDHAEEARRMCDHWHDPAGSDDEHDWLHAGDHSPLNSDRVCSPMGYHKL